MTRRMGTGSAVDNPRRKAISILARMGCAIDEDLATVDAPSGHLFLATMGHELALVNPPEYPGIGFVKEVWRDLIDRLDYGIAPCHHEDCEICG